MDSSIHSFEWNNCGFVLTYTIYIHRYIDMSICKKKVYHRSYYKLLTFFRLQHLRMGKPWGNSGALFFTFSDYSENSTVHGVKYITDKVNSSTKKF